MTKKKGHPSRFTRLVIYPVVGALFLLILLTIILLATGYKFTFQNNRLTLKKTGMIIVYTKPSDVEIHLNGKIFKKSTLPFISTKINALIPGNYYLEIKKKGYIDWHKNLTVYPDLVTWANYVLLFPVKNNPEQLENLNGYKVDGSNKTNRYLLVESSDQAGKKTFKLYDSSNRELTDVWPTISPVETWLQNPEILAADFNSNSRKILLTVKNGTGVSYATLDLNAKKLSVVATTPSVPFSKLIWNPGSSNEIVGLAGNILYRVDTSKDSLSAEQIETEVIDYSVLDGSVYYVAKQGQNSILNKIQTDGTRKTNIAESVTPSSKYKFQYGSHNNTLALLATDSGSLTVYYYLNNLFSSIKLGSNITDMSWSKDGNRLNYFNQDNIYCYDWEKQKEISGKNASKVSKMIWYYDNYHLFYQDEKGFGVVEFDGGNRTAFSDSNTSFVINQSSFMYSLNENNSLSYYRLNISF